MAMILSLEQYKVLKGVEDDGRDAMIEALLPLVEEDYLHIRGRALDEGEALPWGARLVVADMVEWRLEELGRKGVTSETIGDYSVSYTDSTDAYPASVTRRIRRYLEVHE